VVVTKYLRAISRTQRTAIHHLIAGLIACATLWAQITSAAVLPEDRADILLHSYEGDNSTFKGPSVLVRKQFKERVSVWGNYYIDMNSAASIDVLTQGSAYEEERVESSVGVDFLQDKTILSLAFTNSSENDYEANSVSFGLSQDFFGDLSTVSLSYSKGEDDVYQNVRVGSGKGDIVDRNLAGNAEHQRFGIGWTQILTKSWIVAIKAEASVDEGFLRNPYRSVRYIAQVDGELVQQGRQSENYPTTRNSQALAINSMVYLPYRAALKLEARTFTDSWDIQANNFEIKYTQPFGKNFIFDLRYRYYDQTQADFYSDLFNFRDEFEFRASDKELSTFNNTAIGFGVTYDLNKDLIGWFDRATVNLFYDRINYQYENFSDKRRSISLDGSGTIDFQPGSEPQFTFDADILRLFVSFWY